MLHLPGLLQPEPLSLQQVTADLYLHRKTLRHSKAGLAQPLVGSLGSRVHKILFEPSEHLAAMQFDSKHDFTHPPPHHLVQDYPLPLDVGYLFLVGSNILLLMVLQLLFAILEFSQEKISTYSSTLLSCENQEH